jgi:hypothetical protein
VKSFKELMRCRTASGADQLRHARSGLARPAMVEQMQLRKIANLNHVPYRGARHC